MALRVNLGTLPLDRDEYGPYNQLGLHFAALYRFRATAYRSGTGSGTSSAASAAKEKPFMPADTHALTEKIAALPAERLGEVEDFVDFLAAKARRLAAMDRLLAIAPALEAAGAPPVTDDEVQAEIDAMRAARPSRSSRADRS